MDTFGFWLLALRSALFFFFFFSFCCSSRLALVVLSAVVGSCIRRGVKKAGWGCVSGVTRVLLLFFVGVRGGRGIQRDRERQ